MELDRVAGPDEGQDADLRVPGWSARDEGAVAHLSYETVRRLLVRWVIGAGEHPNSLAYPAPG